MAKRQSNKQKPRRKSRKVQPTKEVTFEGEVYNLPIVARGKRPTKKQKIQVAEFVAMMYATDRYPIAEVLAYAGINSESTWWTWRHQYEEIEELYQKALQAKHSRRNERLVERANLTIENALEGHKVKLTTRKGEMIDILDADGNKTGQQTIRTQEITEKEVYIRPNLTAAFYVLNNLDGRNFTKNPEPYKAGNERIPTKIEVEILGDTGGPVTSEQQIEDVDESYLDDRTTV